MKLLYELKYTVKSVKNCYIEQKRCCGAENLQTRSDIKLSECKADKLRMTVLLESKEKLHICSKTVFRRPRLTLELPSSISRVVKND